MRTTRIASLMLGVLTGCSAVGGGSVGLLFDDGGLVLGVDAPRADVVAGRDVKNREALANPEALELFRDHPELSA